MQNVVSLLGKVFPILVGLTFCPGDHGRAQGYTPVGRPPDLPTNVNYIPLRNGIPLDQAIMAGRDWLLRHRTRVADQTSYWNAHLFTANCGQTPCPGGNTLDSSLTVTALASLVLVECGNTLRKGKHRPQLVAATKWMKHHLEGENGNEPPRFSQADHQALALATISISWQASHARYFLLRHLVKRMLANLDNSTLGKTSGLAKINRPRNSIIWTLLTAHELTVYPFPSFRWPPFSHQTLATFDQWLLTRPTVLGIGNPTENGLDQKTIKLAWTYFNILKNHHGALPQTQYALANLQQMNKPGNQQLNPWYFYFSTRILANRKGPLWTRWRQTTVDHLLAQQQKDGCARGSWLPGNPRHKYHGRIYHTALMTLILLRCRAATTTPWLVPAPELNPDTLQLLIYPKGNANEKLHYMLQGVIHENIPLLMKSLKFKLKNMPISPSTLVIKSDYGIKRSRLTGLIEKAKKIGFRKVAISPAN